MGDFDGEDDFVGTADGTRVGDEDGLLTGAFDGIFVGIPVGTGLDLVIEGKRVVVTEGTMDGIEDFVDGDTVLDPKGGAEGSLDGFRDGIEDVCALDGV